MPKRSRCLLFVGVVVLPCFAVLIAMTAVAVAAPGLNDVPSVKEHGDLIWTMMLLFAAGLLATSLWIFNNINKNIDRLAKSVEAINETLADEVFPRLASSESCAKAICTAHNINHPGQNLTC